MINAVHILLEVYSLLHDLYCTLCVSLKAHVHLSSYLSLNREGHWGTTDDFTTSFLRFSQFFTAFWDLAWTGLSIHWCCLLSSHLFLCLPCLLLPFIVPCKMVLARPNERETWPYHCGLRHFTLVRRVSCGPKIITIWQKIIIVWFHVTINVIASSLRTTFIILSWQLRTLSGELGHLVGKSARLMIKRLWVWIPAGVAREFSSLELTLCADSYLVSVPSLCYCSGTWKTPNLSSLSHIRLILAKQMELMCASWSPL